MLPLVFMQERAYQFCTDSGDTAIPDFVPKTSLRSYDQESHIDPDKHSDIGDTVNHNHSIDGHNGQSQHHMDSTSLPDYLKVNPHELRSQDRETALSRYKEKKKTRRYAFLPAILSSMLTLL